MLYREEDLNYLKELKSLVEENRKACERAKLLLEEMEAKLHRVQELVKVEAPARRGTAAPTDAATG